MPCSHICSTPICPFLFAVSTTIPVKGGTIETPGKHDTHFKTRAADLPTAGNPEIGSRGSFEYASAPLHSILSTTLMNLNPHRYLVRPATIACLFHICAVCVERRTPSRDVVHGVYHLQICCEQCFQSHPQEIPQTGTHLRNVCKITTGCVVFQRQGYQTKLVGGSTGAVPASSTFTCNKVLSCTVGNIMEIILDAQHHRPTNQQVLKWSESLDVKPAKPTLDTQSTRETYAITGGHTRTCA